MTTDDGVRTAKARALRRDQDEDFLDTQSLALTTTCLAEAKRGREPDPPLPYRRIDYR